MQKAKIEFYKLRDFSAKLNALVEFLRENIGRLVVVLLLIGGPVALLFSLIFKNLFSAIFALESAEYEEAADTFAFLGGNYLLLIVLSWLASTFIVGVTYTYMKLYNEGVAKETSLGDIFRMTVSKYGGLLVLGFLISLVTVFGFFFFFIPGIYLAVTLSIAFPIYMFEDISVGGAFSRSFTLIKGKWWSTFGLLVVTYIIANIVSGIFSIPFMVVYFMNIFTLMEEIQNDPNSTDAIVNIFSSGYMSVSLAIAMIGGYLTYSIPLVGLGYQYSNLVERSEGKGLMDEIEDFDKEG